MKTIRRLLGFLFIISLLIGIITIFLRFAPLKQQVARTVTPNVTLPRIPTEIRLKTQVVPTNSFAVSPTIAYLPRLTPQVDEKEIQRKRTELLMKQGICAEPCYWGIRPGYTTINEAMNTFYSLGASLTKDVEGSTANYYSTSFKYSDEIYVDISIIEHNEIIEFVKTILVFENNSSIANYEWLVYSPKNVISSYGTPSRIEFVLGMAPSEGITPNISYVMTIYYDDLDLILRYSSPVFLNYEKEIRVCPLSTEFESVVVWQGREVDTTPQKEDVTIEKASSLSIDQFVKTTQTKDKDAACITLHADEFFLAP